MKKMPIWTLVLIIGVICLAVCLLPWYRRINIALPGVEIPAGGTAEDDITLYVEGWYRNYIFRQDTVQASIRIQAFKEDEDVEFTIDAPTYNTGGAEIWASATYYDETSDRYDVVMVAFDETMDVFVISFPSKESIYVAASGIDEKLPDILKKFDVIID